MKIKVLVVDDSSLFRQMIIQNLSSKPNIEVVGYAINAYDAQQKIPQLKPDVLTLDVEMPGMSGIEFLKKLLPTNPIPVVLVSSLNLSVFDALSAGAIDFVRKPDVPGKRNFDRPIIFSGLHRTPEHDEEKRYFLLLSGSQGTGGLEGQSPCCPARQHITCFLGSSCTRRFSWFFLCLRCGGLAAYPRRQADAVSASDTHGS